VISEINYHPPQKLEGAGFVDNFEDEYIELQNTTGAAVQLYDVDNPFNTWRIRGGVEFDFPLGTTIPANGRLLVVSFHPTNNPAAASAFRTRHGLSSGVLLAGPFSGQLASEGEDIQLLRPDAPVPPPDPDEGLVPFILVDRVDYRDVDPWPIAADGFGPSLQRVSSTAFGNDPANWVAATITPAGNVAAGNPPIITSHPTNRAVFAFSDVTLSVTATGDAPLRYQWTFEGDSLPGQTNSSLVLSRVTPAQEGTYRVLVLNASGSAVSSNAVVAIPGRITQQPQDTQAHITGTAIFVVQVTSRTPLTYRWRKNGAFIVPEKTNSFLNIPGVQASDAGLYDVVISHAVGSITSDAARLTVLSNPVITSQPIDITVTVLTPLNVTNSVIATSATPLRYQWYFEDAPLTPSASIPSVTNAALVINNVQLSHAGDYFVVVSDNFGSVTSRIARVTVNTRAVVTLHGTNQVTTEGGTVAISSSWTGSGPFLHRWRRVLPAPAVTLAFIVHTNGLGHHAVTNACCMNGYITASQTNSVLVFTNVSASMAGSSYDIIVSNSVGQIQSDDAFLSVIADTDRDGLPDSWETGRSGFSISNPADALRDDDNDTVNNGDEYFAGTDYLNATSYLRSSIQASGSVQLTFPGVSNRTYTVQYNDNLGVSGWSNLVIEPGEITNRTVTVTDPTPRPRRYYRMVTPAQP
jgi:hypothetical protein